MKWLVVSDMQVPYHDPKAINLMLEVAKDVAVDGILGVGDEIDFPQISRWHRATALEFSKTLQKDIDTCVDVLRDIVSVVPEGAPVHWMRSNHQERLSHYLAKQAPGLDGLRELEYERLMRFDELGITFHKEPFKFTNSGGGWCLIHGDEGGLSRIAGSTAMGIARRLGMSTIGGHTHRLGLQHDNSSMNGRVTRHLFGVETGHLMQLAKAAYTRGSANWNAGFAILEDEGNVVTPQLIPIIHRKVVINGKVYRA